MSDAKVVFIVERFIQAVQKYKVIYNKFFSEFKNIEMKKILGHTLLKYLT